MSNPNHAPMPTDRADAIASRHALAEVIAREGGRIASGYDRTDAITEARSFLADRPHLAAADAHDVLAEHRHWRP